MNKLKLRVWDDVLREMLYSKVEQFDDAILFRFSKHLETENPVYLRHIGLDKKGKDVYEGDIVRLLDGCINCVEFFEMGKIMGHLNTVEVIGNIYENPRLKDATCSTCEHLNDEDVCEIKKINQNPDNKSCENYEWCGYDLAADPCSFSFCY